MADKKTFRNRTKMDLIGESVGELLLTDNFNSSIFFTGKAAFPLPTFFRVFIRNLVPKDLHSWDYTIIIGGW